jgi:AraC family transcriptional regulator, dual regulator of chb operon
MHTAQIKSFLSSGEFYHIARNKQSVQRNYSCGVHDHDFYEVFWIEEGRGGHLINGKQMKLSRGDIIFIRPSDSHSIKHIANGEMTFVNLAFSSEDWLVFKKRFFSNEDNFWGGHQILPMEMKLNDIQILQLAETVDKLKQQSKSALMLEWFLADLFRILTPSQQINENIPSWLSQALTQVNKPEYFRRGSSVLSELSFKSKEHTSRMTVKYLKKTPSEIINECRLNYASHALITTDLSILNLSIECGFKSLAQFYSLFKKKFNHTPRQYRVHHKSIN